MSQGETVKLLADRLAYVCHEESLDPAAVLATVDKAIAEYMATFIPIDDCFRVRVDSDQTVTLEWLSNGAWHQDDDLYSGPELADMVRLAVERDRECRSK